MKKLLAMVLSVVLLLCLCGCSVEIEPENESESISVEIVGTWRDVNSPDNVLTFYEGGVGEEHIYDTESFTWTVEGEYVKTHFEDTRHTQTIVGPATGKEYDFEFGSAAHTDVYKIDMSSYPYRIINVKYSDVVYEKED